MSQFSQFSTPCIREALRMTGSDETQNQQPGSSYWIPSPGDLARRRAYAMQEGVEGPDFCFAEAEFRLGPPPPYYNLRQLVIRGIQSSAKGEISDHSVGEVLGTTHNRLSSRHRTHQPWIGISMNNSDFVRGESPNFSTFAKYLRFALEIRRRSHTLIVIPSELQAINIYGRNTTGKMSWEEAVSIARSKAASLKSELEGFFGYGLNCAYPERYASRNHPSNSPDRHIRLESLALKKVAQSLWVASWNDLINQPQIHVGYERNLDVLNHGFKNISQFAERVRAMTKGILSKGYTARKEFTLEQEDYLCQYFLREAALIICGVSWNTPEGVINYDLLPYTVMGDPQRLIYDLQKGITFPQISKSLWAKVPFVAVELPIH